MLEYREFPVKTAIYYLLYSPFVGYAMFVVDQLIEGTLFLNPGVDHPFLLGQGLGIAAIIALLAGQFVDRTRRGHTLLTISAIIPLLIGVYANSLGFPLSRSPDLETTYVLALFSGLASTLVSWGVLLNQTVVVRFRGRVVAAFLSLSLLVYAILTSLVGFDLSLSFSGFYLPEILALVALIIGFYVRPWRMKLHPLAVKDDAKRYFLVMVLMLASFILWYFSTQMKIEQLFEEYSTEPFFSLLEHSNLGIFHLMFMVFGAIVAGILADARGRKMAFSTAVLILGNLAIFGETFYFVGGTVVTPVAIVYSIPLLAWERFLEGYLLGLCLLLIWSELGAPGRKGLRLSLVILFFIGFVALFFASSLEIPFGGPPALVRELGGPFAVFLALVALWQTAPLPQILGREIEMEDFALDLDQKMVDKTVSAFLQDEDFESIKTQMEVIDATEEFSNGELNEFLGEDLKKMLPLKRVKGIGSSLEKKLLRAGYDSAAQLAGETPKRLAERIEGLSEKQAESILLNARKAVQKLTRSKK